jgi:hypothetical protein
MVVGEEGIAPRLVRAFGERRRLHVGADLG